MVVLEELGLSMGIECGFKGRALSRERVVVSSGSTPVVLSFDLTLNERCESLNCRLRFGWRTRDEQLTGLSESRSFKKAGKSEPRLPLLIPLADGQGPLAFVCQTGC